MAFLTPHPVLHTVSNHSVCSSCLARTCTIMQANSTQYVLRKKPPGKVLASAHAVEREFQVLAALKDTPVPVPKALCLCQDAAVIGTPFYVMEHVQASLHLIHFSLMPVLPNLSSCSTLAHVAQEIHFSTAPTRPAMWSSSDAAAMRFQSWSMPVRVRLLYVLTLTLPDCRAASLLSQLCQNSHLQSVLQRTDSRLSP